MLRDCLTECHESLTLSIFLSIFLSGAKGDNPAAIKSAFTKLGKSASVGKNSRAKVVLPEPFGPAMMTMRLFCADEFMISI